MPSNDIRLTGRITPGFEGRPAVRTITKKDSEEIAGYAAQIEFKPISGTKAFISLTDWNPRSGLTACGEGDTIEVTGGLDQDAWKDESETWKRRFQIAVTTVEKLA